MKKIESVAEMSAVVAEWRAAGQKVALVPTMGALHAGKAALVRAAAAKADVVVVSIFVNPLQFGPNELPASYPRSLESDLAVCAANGVAVVFAPPVEVMFPRGHATFVSEEATSKPLCGASRPGHFRGVTTVMAKLCNIVRPQFAFFGQKAAQRAAVVRRMADELSFGVEIVVVPTVREADGLAAGVSTEKFTASQRQEALALSKALKCAKDMADAGVRSTDRLIAEATHILGQHRRVRVIYVAIVDGLTMETMRDVVPGKSLLAIAAWVDEVRLIDNVVL
jgi:pantoate--beta-alanine ligase